MRSWRVTTSTSCSSTSLTKWLPIAHTPGTDVNGECVFLRYCFTISNFTVQVHPPALPPGDPYVPDERVENLQRLRQKNSFTDFKMDVYLRYFHDYAAPQSAPRRILDVTLPRRGRCIGCHKKMVIP
ncbi:hypothetical protein KIN20_025421 [Parelaphostrongylus tenuis]|uniref:Uncharacterized protein n=1 Tax=Parelaphostrongylus tenuis TaxID=148309 RepID=A0AAD5QX86_PARTN|nr:hypothetical protein KIN20_025421 [Parelaphostrongylus tenuis]